MNLSRVKPIQNFTDFSNGYSEGVLMFILISYKYLPG